MGQARLGTAWRGEAWIGRNGMEPIMGESAGEFISIGRYDWYVTRAWRKLHAVRDEDWSAVHRADMEESWAVLHSIRLACGRMAASVFIPGMFVRMGADRCTGCCRALGYPPGKGSPKNDDACRALLGLHVDGNEEEVLDAGLRVHVAYRGVQR